MSANPQTVNEMPFPEYIYQLISINGNFDSERQKNLIIDLSEIICRIIVRRTRNNKLNGLCAELRSYFQRRGYNKKFGTLGITVIIMKFLETWQIHTSGVIHFLNCSGTDVTDTNGQKMQITTGVGKSEYSLTLEEIDRLNKFLISQLQPSVYELITSQLLEFKK